MKVWLVYRPALGYEDSEVPFFVCTTEAVAKAHAKRMNDFAHRLHKRLPRLPDVPSRSVAEDHPDSVAFDLAYDKFEAIRNRARWPYGINLFNDREEDEIVAVKPLDVRSVP